jgi:predicted phage tail protein
MRASWKQSGPALRTGLVAAITFLVVGLTVLVVSFFSTIHGSEAFDSGMSISRILLQVGAVSSLIVLAVVVSRRQREKKAPH